MPKKEALAFKIHVKYQDDAHDEQNIAVPRNPDILTVADAEAHCRRACAYRDVDTGEVYPCVEAKAVFPYAVPVSQLPMTPEAIEALKKNSMEIK